MRENTDRPGARAAHWILALVAMGCAVRLTGLDRHSIWFDEAGTLHVALAPDLVEAIAGDRHPPLSQLLFRGWAALVGQGDAALRLLPALLSCLALAGLARLARGWLSERGALWTVALAALAPFLVWNAQEVRMYAFVELGTVAALLGAQAFAARSARAFPLGPWLAIVLGTAFAFGSHYLGGLAGASVAAVALVERWRGAPDRLRGRRLAALVAAPVVGGALWLPWLVAMLGRQLESDWGFQAKTAPRDLVELPARFVLAHAGFLAGPARFLVLAAGAALLVAVAAHAVASLRRRRPGELAALACLVAPIAGGLALTLVTTAPYFKARYLTAAAPGALLCAGAGIALVPWRWPRRALGGLVLAGCVVLLALHRVENRREDYRTACTELVEHWREGDRVIAICHAPEPFAQAPLRHYLRGRPDVLAALLDGHAYFEDGAYPLPPGTRLHVIYREHDDAWRRLTELVDTHAELLRGERRIRIQHLLFEVPGA